ncbi:hypothetical protein [Sphingobium sp. Ndbn-10]|uniref:hypothetical protein n=2 Tax=Sphingomonadaceae TaxID=41297 RepID=UPI00101FD094|nr:hypothetical protein [Sphingobium sp. Ndbn-10]
MALPIPSLQDVVRLTGPDVATTAANFRRHLRGAGPVWGYNPSKRLAKAVFSLEMVRDAAVESCGRIGHKLGRPHNAQVGGLIWDAATERGQFMCHDLSPRMLNLRSDIAIKVDPQFFFIEQGRPVIFYLQPRRGHVPGVDGLRVIATAIHSLFAIDELSAADLLLLDLSMPTGCNERAVVSYSFSDLPPLPTIDIERLFQRFVDAYDLVSAEGVERKPRRSRPAAERGDDLFGNPPAE